MNITKTCPISGHHIEIFAEGGQFSVIKSEVKTVFAIIYYVYIITIIICTRPRRAFSSLNEIKIFVVNKEFQTNKILTNILFCAKPSYLSRMRHRDSTVICIV